jgi:hypothetical protein
MSNLGEDLPSNEVLGFRSKLNIFREMKSLSPVHNLPIRVMGLFGAERRPTNLTFKHNSSKTPPVAVKRVAITSENFWSNVIWSPHSGVRHDSSRLPPIIDNSSVAYCKIDLVKIHRIPITLLAGRVARALLQELLIVGVVMESIETSGQAKVSKLDMTSTIKKNVIRFNVAAYR